MLDLVWSMDECGKEFTPLMKSIPMQPHVPRVAVLAGHSLSMCCANRKHIVAYALLQVGVAALSGQTAHRLPAFILKARQRQTTDGGGASCRNIYRDDFPSEDMTSSTASTRPAQGFRGSIQAE